MRILSRQKTIFQRFFTTYVNSSYPNSLPSHEISKIDEITPLTKKICERISKSETSALSKAITLGIPPFTHIVESKLDSDYHQAQYVLNYIKNINKSKPSLRIGITGSPGAGKSTFIESFGLFLIEKGHRVSVLAVDPSSSKTGGSILGDKTRMMKLSSSDHSFIRPSPSRGFLGGVTANTHEIITLCESCGFDIVLVETVGVGQSEVQIADLVDLCILVVPPASGDELQAIKKGIVEVSDLIIVNKADGVLLPSAKQTLSQYKHAIHFLHNTSVNGLASEWEPKVLLCSSLMNVGLENIFSSIKEFQDQSVKNGNFDGKRKEQNKRMMWRQIHEEIVNVISKTNFNKLEQILSLVETGKYSPKYAARSIVEEFISQPK